MGKKITLSQRARQSQHSCWLCKQPKRLVKEIDEARAQRVPVPVMVEYLVTDRGLSDATRHKLYYHWFECRMRREGARA